MILLLFTASYPYDASAEQTFLSEELLQLKPAFDRVLIVPGTCRGTRLPVPDGFEVDESYADFLRANRFAALVCAVLSPILYKDILERPAILLHRNMLMRLINFVGRAVLTRIWVGAWIARSGYRAGECIFYTYWFDNAAMGIGLVKHQYPEIRLVSRAHGYDLYEERHPFNYWPCRRYALSYVDRLYLDSEAGLNYISSRYPEYQSKYRTGLLGVKPAGFRTMQSNDDTFRIVSCSLLVPVKRVDLILEGIACAARRAAGARFEWHHFGNGDLRDDLQERVDTTFPPNARGFLPGYSTQSDLFRFYRENPVDVFVNASVSEGTPVAIMEAISCGIPVIATSVGGNMEIVTSRNGSLLPPNPSADEIATALLEMRSDRETIGMKRAESFRLWQEKYNAESNFREFARALVQIRNS